MQDLALVQKSNLLNLNVSKYFFPSLLYIMLLKCLAYFCISEITN